MDVNGASYETVLKEAQELGYAEADPTGDVEGFDSTYKLTTLATITFNRRVKLENVYREGISRIQKEDIKYANELGYTTVFWSLAYNDWNNKIQRRNYDAKKLKHSMMLTDSGKIFPHLCMLQKMFL